MLNQQRCKAINICNIPYFETLGVLAMLIFAIWWVLND